MRILTDSDLHLEFGSGWTLPPQAEGDLLILAGDIVTLRDYALLDQEIAVGGVHFFGGAMWTDFHGADPHAMARARGALSDFHLIRNPDG